MTLTHTPQSLLQASDHEAGHFVAARVCGIKSTVYYVTVEPRELVGGTVGMQIREPGESTLEQEAMLAIGGLAAECYGAFCRHYQFETLKGQPELYVVCLSRLEEKVIQSFERNDGDFHVVAGDEGFDRTMFATLIPKCLELIADNWAAVTRVSMSLREHTTLFHEEATLAMDDHWGFPAHLFYRKKRRSEDPPEAWLRGSNEDFPAGPYFEGALEFFDRLKMGPGETVQSWVERCELTSEDLQDLKMLAEEKRSEALPDEERADHEAGHYFIAFETHPTHIVAFITIEVGSTPKGQRIGGNVALKPVEEPTPEQWGTYIMGGMAAQMHGINLRNGWETGDPRAKEAIVRVVASCEGDTKDFTSRFGEARNSTEHLEKADHLIKENWALVAALSKELQVRRTLYYEEAWLVLNAVRSEDEVKDRTAKVLATYREHRQEVNSGKDFENFTAHYPGLKFFESCKELLAREPHLFKGEEDEEVDNEDEDDGEHGPSQVEVPVRRVDGINLGKSIAKALASVVVAKIRAKIPWK